MLLLFLSLLCHQLFVPPNSFCCPFLVSFIPEALCEMSPQASWSLGFLFLSTIEITKITPEGRTFERSEIFITCISLKLPQEADDNTDNLESLSPDGSSSTATNPHQLTRHPSRSNNIAYCYCSLFSCIIRSICAALSIL